jgi:hypothetical protein
MENSSLIFEMALGLSSPWYIKNISFEQSGEVRELHIYIDLEKGFKFKQEDSSESTAQ